MSRCEILPFPRIGDAVALRALLAAATAGASQVEAPPVAVRTPAPPPGPAPRPTVVVIHLTNLAPRIPADMPRHDPARWATYHSPPPERAVARLLERIGRRAFAVMTAVTPQGEVAFYDADPARPIALVCEGLSLDQVRAALETLKRADFAALRPEGAA